jgi:hypothetical protein
MSFAFPSAILQGKQIVEDKQMNQRVKKIGVLTLAEPVVIRQSFETASWFRDIKVPAGEYPLEATLTPEGMPQFILASMPGVCVGSLFVNRLLNETSADRDGDVGKPFSAGFHSSGYLIAEAAMTGNPYPVGDGIGTVVLNPDMVQVDTYQYDHENFTTKEMESRTGYHMTFARPLNDILKEQAAENRIPLTEDHEVVFELTKSAVISGGTEWNRLHALPDGTFKGVKAEGWVLDRAKVTAVETFDNIDDAADWLRQQVRFVYPHHIEKIDAAVEDWKASHDNGFRR